MRGVADESDVAGAGFDQFELLGDPVEPLHGLPGALVDPRANTSVPGLERLGLSGE